MSEMAPESHSKITAFIQKVDEAMHEVFDVETDHPAVVVGLQFAASESDAPVFLSSNLPICLVGAAIHDMHDAAAEQHDAFHEATGQFMDVDPGDESIPQEVRDFAARLAADNGLDPSQVVIQAQVGTDDLNDDGIARLIGTPYDIDSDEPGEKFVLTGKDDIAAVDLDGDTATGEGMPEGITAEREQDFESGSQNEG